MSGWGVKEEEGGRQRKQKGRFILIVYLSGLNFTTTSMALHSESYLPLKLCQWPKPLPSFPVISKDLGLHQPRTSPSWVSSLNQQHWYSSPAKPGICILTRLLGIQSWTQRLRRSAPRDSSPLLVLTPPTWTTVKLAPRSHQIICTYIGSLSLQSFSFFLLSS